MGVGGRSIPLMWSLHLWLWFFCLIRLVVTGWQDRNNSSKTAVFFFRTKFYCFTAMNFCCLDRSAPDIRTSIPCSWHSDIYPPCSYCHPIISVSTFELSVFLFCYLFQLHVFRSSSACFNCSVCFALPLFDAMIVWSAFTFCFTLFSAIRYIVSYPFSLIDSTCSHRFQLLTVMLASDFRYQFPLFSTTC